MTKKFIIIILIFSLLILNLSPQDSYAGGAGGEPMISDSVGWGIVGVMALVGIYFIYTIRQESTAEKEKTKDKAKNITTTVQAAASGIVSPTGCLIIAQW